MRAFAAFAALLLSAVAPDAHAIDITECFQAVPPGETGELLVDLSCVGPGDGPGGNVYLGVGARLNLNGHSISGGVLGVLTNAGSDVTRIIGPGEIRAVAGPGPQTGCAVIASTPMRIEDVILRDNDCGLDRVYNQTVRLDGVTITGNTRDGISSTLPGPGMGKIRGANLTISDNGGNGITSNGKAKLEALVVTGNGLGGVVLDSDRRSRISSGTLTGNGPAGDIAARRAPKFVESTCGNSVDLDDGGTLGICLND